MSGLSYFALQIQSWFFKTQSKSNHGPKFFSMHCSTQKVQKFWKCSFFTTKCRMSFPSTQSNSGPVPKFWND